MEAILSGVETRICTGRGTLRGGGFISAFSACVQLNVPVRWAVVITKHLTGDQVHEMKKKVDAEKSLVFKQAERTFCMLSAV